jgi:integrase
VSTIGQRASDRAGFGMSVVPGEAGRVGQAAVLIAAYAPRSLSVEAANFVRMVVAKAQPRTPARAKALLFAAGRLACFGESIGLELSAGVLLDSSVIERLIVVSEGTVSSATRRTLRTNLRAIARAVELHPQPEPLPLARERAKRPYSDAEIAGYLALADALSTRARRMRASALICLGAGAGLIGSELRHLTGSDVIWRSGGLVLVVGGERARVVPVLARFQAPLAAAAEFAGHGYLIGGSDPERRNLTDALTVALSADAGLPRLEGGRLRASWLCRCAQLIGLQAFMQAAGVRCTQRLGDLVSYLPVLEEEEAVALLGAAA